MAEQREKRNVVLVYDAESGFQVMDRETGEIADMAVLEGTWRDPGKPIPGASGNDVKPSGIPLKSFGGLRIRSSGLQAYDIWQVTGEDADRQ